jgi:hypothetical protein
MFLHKEHYSGYIVIDYLLNLNGFYNNLLTQNHINKKHMEDLNAVGLYMDGYDFVSQRIVDSTGAENNEGINPECCDEGRCGTDECGCKNKPVLIQGISGSVKEVLNIVER